MGNWKEDVARMDPKTGESLSGDPDAREQRLRNIEAVKRFDAGDIEGAMQLIGAEDSSG